MSPDTLVASRPMETVFLVSRRVGPRRPRTAKCVPDLVPQAEVCAAKRGRELLLPQTTAAPQGAAAVSLG
jgi:hypothetical protein